MRVLLGGERMVVMEGGRGGGREPGGVRVLLGGGSMVGMEDGRGGGGVMRCWWRQGGCLGKLLSLRK